MDELWAILAGSTKNGVRQHPYTASAYCALGITVLMDQHLPYLQTPRLFDARQNYSSHRKNNCVIGADNPANRAS
jgi:hypothetical protein